jgi:hypothetical protein
MDNFLIKTAAGEFPVNGRRYIDDDPSRPTLVIVTGAFPPKGHMHEMVSDFSGVSVITTAVPGMYGSAFEDLGLDSLHRSFDRLLETLVPTGPIVTFGLSTGCLLTLGATSPRIVRQLLFEPFFTTANLWPFLRAEQVKAMMAHPGIQMWLWELFGIRERRFVEERDYRFLMDRIKVPTEVMAGGLPLGVERDLPVWPSFLADEDRQTLSRNPMVRWHIGPADAGHGWLATDDGKARIKQVVHEALRAAWPRARAGAA